MEARVAHSIGVADSVGHPAGLLIVQNVSACTAP